MVRSWWRPASYTQKNSIEVQPPRTRKQFLSRLGNSSDARAAHKARNAWLQALLQAPGLWGHQGSHSIQALLWASLNRESQGPS